MKRAAVVVTALLAIPVFAADSPLVQAAKRTNRAKSKSAVITNESVKTSKGHITTTNALRPIEAPAPSAAAETQQSPKRVNPPSEKEKEKQYEQARQPRPVT